LSQRYRNLLAWTGSPVAEDCDGGLDNPWASGVVELEHDDHVATISVYVADYAVGFYKSCASAVVIARDYALN